MTDNRTGKLRIVHTEASLGWGGQEIRILTEAQGMVERGHRVTLLCPPEARIHAAARERGLPVEALPIGRKKPGGVLALRRWLLLKPWCTCARSARCTTWSAAAMPAALPSLTNGGRMATALQIARDPRLSCFS